MVTAWAALEGVAELSFIDFLTTEPLLQTHKEEGLEENSQMLKVTVVTPVS